MLKMKYAKQNKTCHGFTLLEILIALFIFTILSMILVGALRTVINADAGAERNAERLHNLQVTFLLMSHDIEQAVNRPILGTTGREEAAFIGEQHVFSLTHGGLADPQNNLIRSSLQRVTYHLKDKTIVRTTWPVLDFATETKPQDRMLLNDVRDVTFEYLDNNGKLQRAWPSKENNSRKDPLPRAVAMTITINSWGTIKQLYVIPAQPNTPPQQKPPASNEQS